MTLTDTPTKNARRAMPPLFAAIRTLVAHGLCRFHKPRATRRLQLIETLPLGGKRQLLLIACDGRHFLLGAGADAVTAITPIAMPAAAPSADSADRCNAKQSNVAACRSLLQ